MALWLRNPHNAPSWFARLRREHTPAETDTRFRRWLTADPRNEVRYEQQELVWKVAGELEHDQEIQTLLERIETGPRASETRPKSSRHLTLITVACTVLLLALGLVVRFTYQANHEQLYATPIGVERTFVLHDGSTMTLNAATRVRVFYERFHRTVLLEQGEATFSVVPDAARSFDVTAAGGTARALGTQFDVLASGDKITVAVLEGRVAVTAAKGTDTAPVGGTTLVIAGGEQVTYAGAHLDRPEPANIPRIRGWHAGRIVLNNVELGEAITEFNRYSQLPLRLGNPSLFTHRITGVFRSGETDEFLTALKEAFNIRIERTSTAIILQ